MNLSFQITHRYRLIEETRIETGSGGVCQALDLNLGRKVMIKYINLAGENRKQAITRAQDEVKAIILAGEDISNIPKIYETYYDREKYYIVMEYVKGKTLTEKMGLLNETVFLRYMTSLCEILKLLEKKKVYHKDIKPDNIMITDKNALYLIDFNISLSLSNMVEGTPFYKAPEMGANSQYAGREKADMFSIGVIMYEYYTGEVPKIPTHYGRRSSFGPLVWDKFTEPVSVRTDMNPKINDMIVKCMKCDPKERYHSYAELHNALRAVQKGGNQNGYQKNRN